MGGEPVEVLSSVRQWLARDRGSQAGAGPRRFLDKNLAIRPSAEVSHLRARRRFHSAKGVARAILERSISAVWT